MKLNENISSKTRKVRKSLYLSNNNKRRVIMSSPLAKDLKEKLGIRALPLHLGDTVLLKTGKQKIEGTISKVSRKRMKVAIENYKRKNSKGVEKDIFVHPSKLIITNAIDTDARKKVFERRRNNMDVEK